MNNEDVKERLEEQYRESASQAVYRKRKEKAELPFGHIKRNLGVQAFLLRGREGAGAEMGLLTSGFNIRRMMTLLGTEEVVKGVGRGGISRGIRKNERAKSARGLVEATLRLRRSENRGIQDKPGGIKTQPSERGEPYDWFPGPGARSNIRAKPERGDSPES